MKRVMIDRVSPATRDAAGLRIFVRSVLALADQAPGAEAGVSGSERGSWSAGRKGDAVAQVEEVADPLGPLDLVSLAHQVELDQLQQLASPDQVGHGRRAPVAERVLHMGEDSLDGAGRVGPVEVAGLDLGPNILVVV